MFDIGAMELLLIVIVAVIVIGPKDMPLAMRTAGRWIGKMRKISGHFRAGIDTMVREAEMEDMEKKWKAQNEKILREHPQESLDEMRASGVNPSAGSAESKQADVAPASAPAPASGSATTADLAGGDAGNNGSDAAPKT